MSEAQKQSSPEKVLTPGGMEAIQIEGLFIRNSYVGSRLESDGETFEEYKFRQKMVQAHKKRNKKGNLVFTSVLYSSSGQKLYAQSYVKPK